MKITEYPSVTDLTDDNVFLIDGSSGTKTIAKSDLIYALYDNIPEMHNKIYRNKNLGSSYTTAQKEAISSGTFHDLWVGDYWTSGGHKWFICGFDCFRNNNSDDHHIVVIGSAPAPNIAWDSTKEGPEMGQIAYSNSTIYKTALPNYISNTIPAMFKDNSYEHGVNLVTAKEASTNKIISIGSVRLFANILSAANVFGTANPYPWIKSTTWFNSEDPSARMLGVKFPIFNFLKPFEVTGAGIFWLMDDNGPLGLMCDSSNGSGLATNNKNALFDMVAYIAVKG